MVNTENKVNALYDLPQKALDRWPDHKDQTRLEREAPAIKLIARRSGAGNVDDYVKGKSFLVIGCGSSAGVDNPYQIARQNQAWGPRYFWSYDAGLVVGVDLYPQDASDIDIYTHIQENIVPPIVEGTFRTLFQSLPLFDCVVAKGIFIYQGPSKTMHEQLEWYFDRSVHEEDFIHLQEQLLTQLPDITNDGAFVRLEGDMWRKHDDTLSFIS